MAWVDSLGSRDDRDTYSLDSEAFYNDSHSFFPVCTMGIAVEGVEEVEEVCIVYTDHSIAYYFGVVEGGYYLVDMKALAYLDCNGFDWGACRALGSDTVDTLEDTDPFAYALDGVDTYMVDNKKQADSLDFYYYLRSH
jgi:hypothetical protein